LQHQPSLIGLYWRDGEVQGDEHHVHDKQLGERIHSRSPFDDPFNPATSWNFQGMQRSKHDLLQELDHHSAQILADGEPVHEAMKRAMEGRKPEPTAKRPRLGIPDRRQEGPLQIVLQRFLSSSTAGVRVSDNFNTALRMWDANVRCRHKSMLEISHSPFCLHYVEVYTPRSMQRLRMNQAIAKAALKPAHDALAPFKVCFVHLPSCS